MDMQQLHSQVLPSLNADGGLIEKFKKDPMATVQGLLGDLNLNTDSLEAIVKGVTAKLDIDDTVKDAKGLLGKITSLFGK